MGWSLGWDDFWNRDIGYGVPCECDHPNCNKQIDRGLAYVCGGKPYGGDEGCGLYFCGDHLFGPKCLCERCINGIDEKFSPKQDVKEWTDHKMTHESWAEWRKEQGLE